MSEPGNQEQPTPKELYEKANRLVEAGRRLEAVPLYEQAGYFYPALKICEEEGDIQRAYQIAMRASDHYSADRIVAQYHIVGQSYLIPNGTERVSIPNRKMVLKL